MEKILPLFPLSLVVYPNEDLNLHIFEPRYKQLIKDCQERGITFGIPTFIDNQVGSYGTEVEVISVERKYDDGKLDIKTQGLQTFEVLTFEKTLEDRLYAGGLVRMMALEDESDNLIKLNLIEKIKELYQILQISSEEENFEVPNLSYAVAHKIGLSIEQEYQLLQIPLEKDRQLYLTEHLDKAIPIINEMERTKQLIRMNGHFKYFDPLNF